MNYYKIAPLRLNLPALIYKSNLALPKNSVVKICVKNKSALGIVLDSAKKPNFECEEATQSEFYLTPNQAVLGKFIASYYCVNEGVAFGIMTLGKSSNSSSLTQSSREIEKSTLDGLQFYHRADFPAQPTNLAQDTRIALANDAKTAESSLDSAKSQNLGENISSLRNFAKQSCGKPPIKKTQKSQGGLPREQSSLAMTENNNFVESSVDSAFLQNLPRLSPTQTCALDFILSHDKTLLFGDTGSGKTEIYINAIARTIAQGKNVIFLMPEISLTPQMERRLKGVFGDLVCIWHSKITKAKKEQILSRLDSANPQNLIKNNPRASANLETRPLRGAKNRNQASSSASADFLLEAEKRGSPPKSEKAAAFWRVGGAGRGVQPFLREETSEISGNGIAESTQESQSGLPRRFCESARNDEFIRDSSLRTSCFAQNDKNSARVAESSEKSPQDAEFAIDSAFLQNLPRLSPTQTCALDFILSHDKTLLFGDTGSGKTEIYINAIARTIAQGKNVIFLMPEISLTPQMERRLKGVFGDLVCIWHSKITKAKKEQILSRLDSAPYHKNAESALDSANSQNLVKKPCYSKSFSCHSERSEESKKNNLVILSESEESKKKHNRVSSVVSLPQNDNLDLDSSLRKCFAQNDKIGAENDKNGVRVAESALDSAKTPIKIIAGARSALFLPLSNIGLIIIDEEHDDAYKSNSAPRYNARDLAIFLAHKEQIRLILGSATPSVNSYYNFSKENCVFRLRGGYFQGKKSVSFDSEILSPNLLEKIRVALENKTQTIVFVPLRGNFKVLQCESCGNGAKCKHCSINMSLHSKKNALICHYCGYAEPFFDGKTKCKICNSTAFRALKIGTQEICKQLQSHFTHAKIAIFDRDEVKSDSKMRKILSEFNEGKIDILVGTQMISKGHDYHNVALVAILGIDGILNSSDFRAYERAVGLLTQISGRTARKNDGEVVINTRNRAFFTPFLNDYEEFLRFELENRKNLYPPFRRIALLIAQNRDESRAKEILQNAKKIVESAHKNIEIIGLNKAPIERINGLWRYFLLLRASSAKELVCAARLCKNLPLIIDIDPQQVF